MTDFLSTDVSSASFDTHYHDPDTSGLLHEHIHLSAHVPVQSPQAANWTPQLTDPFDRKLTYLRLSVTDFCNFRCDYCLPNGYVANGGKRPKNELTVSEIATLVQGFAEMGTRKVRITGGEPSIRGDLSQIISTVANTRGIEKVCLTSNGYKLGKHFSNWLEAGLTQLNISIDSFEPATFAEITGHDILPQLLDDIENILKCERVKKRQNVGQFTLKINAILKAQYAYDNLMAALDYIKARPVTYRFIEFMQTSDNSDLFFAEHASAGIITNYLRKNGWQAKARATTGGPAVEYIHPDHMGSIGMIAPYAPTFCDSCNRVRVNAQGKLHLCLFDSINHDLRPLLQTPDTQALRQAMNALAGIKPEHHHLHDADSGIMANLSLVGG